MQRSKSRLKIAIFASLWLLTGSISSAYEQGTCFVFDVITKDHSKAVAGRLPIEPTESTAPAQSSAFASGPSTKSEFEIDFTKLQTDSSFGTGTENTNSSGSSFDFTHSNQNQSGSSFSGSISSF